MTIPTTDAIPIDALARLPKFALVTASHAGDKLAFYYDVSGRFELYQLDLATRELEQLTDGEAPRGLRSGMAWTRDGGGIVFAKDRAGDEHNDLHLLTLGGGVTTLHADPDSQEHTGEAHPDGRTLAVMSTRGGQMNVWAFDLVERSWRQLTDFAAPTVARGWSPDGAWLAIASNASHDLRNTDGYLVAVDGGEPRKAFSVREGSRDAIVAWHPDGERVAVTSDAEGVTRSGVLTLATGEVRWLGDPEHDLIAQRFSPDGRWLLALRNREATIAPVLFDVTTGAARELAIPEGVAVGSAFVLGGEALVIHHGSDVRRPELILYHLADDRYDVLLEADYGPIDPAAFSPQGVVRYASADGQQVPALLTRPAHAPAHARLPAVVIVHGGPTAQFFRGFDPQVQLLASRGIVVLQPNVRGSTGYGTAWRDANLRDWGGGDLDDVVAGAAYLRSLPFVDGERIGIYGGSYGGFMSYLAVTKRPEVFKVGVPWVGISDLHRLYDEDMAHFQYTLRQQMGDPEENRALWRDRSAVEFVPGLQAKLLIGHGVHDPRCPISQARLFRNRLLENGFREGTDPDDDFEYHEFEDEGHGASGDIAGLERTFRLLTDFLERRL